MQKDWITIFFKKGANYSLHLEKGIESVAYDVWSSSFNFMGPGCLLNSLKKSTTNGMLRSDKKAKRF